MDPFTVVFFPPEGDHHSPATILKNIDRPIDKARITDKLDRISRIEPQYWGQVVKLKAIRKNIIQITVNDYRVYVSLDNTNNCVVVLHICRKYGQKADLRDLDRARENYNAYFNDNPEKER